MSGKIKISIIQKVFLYLFTACILPILFFGWIAYNNTYAIFRDEINNNTYELMHSKQNNLEHMMQNIESLIIRISSLDDIRNILVSDPKDSSYDKLLAQTKIGYILSGYSNLRGLVSIDIFSTQGTHYHVGDTLDYPKINSNAQKRILEEAMKAKTAVTWNGVEDNVNSNSEQTKVITASKIIKVVDSNTMAEKPIGTILVNYNIEAFTESIKGSTRQDTLFMVIDGKYRILHDSHQNQIGDQINPVFVEKMKAGRGSFVGTMNGEEMMITYMKSHKSDWTMMGLVSKKKLNTKTSTIMRNIEMLVLISFAMITFFTFLISSKYISPVRRITELFKQYQSGQNNLKTRLKNNSDDEVGELVTSFNAFWDSLDDKKIMEQDIRKSEFNRVQAEESVQRLIKDDFRNTVKNMQNLVFKLKTNESGVPVFTLFEGKMAKELGYTTDNVVGKTPDEWMKPEVANAIKEGFAKAVCGVSNNFEFKLNEKTMYISLSPVTEGNRNEVVGSAIDITELKNAEEKIRYMAYYDSLTGLPNRVLFIDRIHLALERSKEDKSIFAVMFLDLDQFKFINDSLGHEVGDILLQEVAARLKNCVQNKGMVARMSGDEFAILDTEVIDDIRAAQLAQEVLETIKCPFSINQYELFITTSIGISLYPFHGKNAEMLLKNADIAMYKAKSEGRNNCQFYTSDMELKAVGRLNMETGLRKAIDQEEFLLYYQPKIDIRTGEIEGCETLIRWEHPELGLVSPSDFIPLAEETGLIVPLGEWVLKTACMQVKKWHDIGFEGLNVSVNISAKQFQHQNIIENVSRILEQTGIEPACLELEITENCIMQNTERTVRTIDSLKSIGVKISIDDFGTGFSSMAYLKRFAVDKLKIDKSFITDINTSSSDAAITAAIINMAHSLNLKVVAEGVESEEQLLLLKKYHCDEVQGFMYSKPLSLKDFEEYLQNNMSGDGSQTM